MIPASKMSTPRLVASLVADLRSLRETCGPEYAELDLSGFVRQDATDGFWIDPMADERLHLLTKRVGSRSLAVRCWLAPAVDEADIGVKVIS